MFTTYILYSNQLNKFYIGFTSDAIATRIAKHLAMHKGFTAKAKDWIVVHTEKFDTKPEAIHREKQLKAWKSNTRIKELIARNSNE
jgi:putative endonuclease